MKRKRPLVISLGGSILSPDGIDAAYLKKFITLLKPVARHRRVVVVVGGGSYAREAIAAVEKVGRVPAAELDWVGIAATHLNADAVRAALGDAAYPLVQSDPRRKLHTPRIIVAGGWKPGWSTDADAVHWAHTLGADTVLNLSNIRYVYTADPQKHRDAQPIPEMSWKEFRKQFGSTWTPGAHAPFDPVAARLAQRYRLNVVVLHGRHLANVQYYLRGKSFTGTRITPQVKEKTP